MFHSSARFGTYFIGENFPVNTDRALVSPFSGQTSRASCEAFDEQGNDRGLLRRAVDVRRCSLAAGVRVAERLRVRRLLNRDASRGATLPTHRIRDFSPAPPCAFAY